LNQKSNKIGRSYRFKFRMTLKRKSFLFVYCLFDMLFLRITSTRRSKSLGWSGTMQQYL